MRIKQLLTLQHIALFIVLLFHVSGAIGILFTPYKDWFVQNTPLNLLLMAVLLIITQAKKNLNFFFFSIIMFITGFAAELIGTNTGYLFGKYEYGDVLGIKYYGVPVLIGVNWFIIIYCTGTISQKLYSWSNKQLTAMQTTVKPVVQLISFIVDGALLATLFDYLMEPVAVKLGFWQWFRGNIPFYNYACWFIISLILLTVFRLLPFDKNNRLAVHLFVIQLLFFFLLRTCL